MGTHFSRKQNAMSKLDPLQDAAQVLTSLENEILARLRVADETADAPQMNSAIGRLTYIDAYQQQQVALRARRELESRLAAIRAALTRVKDGTYGRCEGCGAAILPERLQFMPEAPFCVKCNERLGR
jgi:DnaK suppressor protein